MNSSTENGFDRGSAMDAEATLRLIAALPAPDGIEDRVKIGLKTGLKTGLRAAPHQASVIRWPQRSTDGARWTHLSWTHLAGMRAAAAAAIVMVVAGGGWEVYSHIRVAAQPAALVAPERMGGSSGLSAAGAKRKPHTVDGPVVAVPAQAKRKPGAGDGVAVPPTHMAEKSKPAAAAER